MKRLSSLAFIGALALASLTACSSSDGDTTDFCTLADTLGADAGFELPELSDSAMEAAFAGDMSGVNEWGTSVSATLDDISAQIKSARGSAPTDEIAQALDDVAEGMTLMQSFVESAADATDFETFMTDAQSVGTEIEAVDAKMTIAADLLDEAALEYCE